MAIDYKVCGAAEWDEAARVGRYDGSADDRRDGFIHFRLPQNSRARWPGISPAATISSDRYRRGSLARR